MPNNQRLIGSLTEAKRSPMRCVNWNLRGDGM